ncbi:long-chain fatty acid--CoA ligase [Paenibacillus sp. N1-5-1-14]|uniref:class I adenylate-forming enzyme family protein n=1 Tax=Paenibacillus radicibacter TaxID=2972488 RepID=UPI002159AD4C|nr:long-chain fatty acid--CoA ligase [Paenibacillus radicibacter]MCR8644165.1 long-chain fatty acid--CoA ligase [Paenibacillus radicibacter]
MNSVINWMESRCLLSAEHRAVIDSETGESWTYSQLWQGINNMAHYLTIVGIQPGDRVALLAPNHRVYVDLLFACGRIGAVLVPLNWKLATQEMNYILEDCTPKLIVVHPDLSDVAAPLKSESWNFLHMDSEAYRLLMQPLSGNGPIKQVSIELTHPLAIIYTGGTTGHPKGVVLSHQSIFWNATNTIASWNLTESDVTPTYLPMFHTGGLNALSIPVLMAGGSVIIARQFDPIQSMELLIQARCTIVLMVPTMYHMLIQSPEFDRFHFPKSLTFLSGGAPCPLTIYEAFAAKGLAFKEGYGGTETGPNNFCVHPDQARRKPGTVGKSMLFGDVRLVDDKGSNVSIGEIGELVLKGGHLFESYWRQPDLTRHVKRDGWFYTGDLCRQDEDGDYYIVGRKKDMIITGGENVYPLEVEQFLHRHPDIEDAAVVGVPDAKWGEIVAALVVLKEGITLTEEELRQYCSQAIAKYKVPKYIRFVEHLPKTTVGKLDKKRIVQSFQ